MKIHTQHVFPPIPDRSCDWSAVDGDTYDGAPDAHCVIGRGPTELAAINDLVQQLVERAYDEGYDDAVKWAAKDAAMRKSEAAR